MEDLFPTSGALAPGEAGATDLEIDALGKPLNELPPFRERDPAREGRRHADTINLRDDADSADEMPDEPATAGDHKGGALRAPPSHFPTPHLPGNDLRHSVSSSFGYVPSGTARYARERTEPHDVSAIR
jgi:hypothetical protein